MPVKIKPARGSSAQRSTPQIPSQAARRSLKRACDALADIDRAPAGNRAAEYMAINPPPSPNGESSKLIAALAPPPADRRPWPLRTPRFIAAQQGALLINLDQIRFVHFDSTGLARIRFNGASSPTKDLDRADSEALRRLFIGAEDICDLRRLNSDG